MIEIISKNDSIEDIVSRFENSEIPRYESSKLFKLYFDLIKDITEKSADLEKAKKEIFVWDLSTHASPEPLFSPMLSGTFENGQEYNYPDLELFDETYVAYFKERFNKTTNSICKCRYGDILWQLKRDFSIVRETIKSHLTCANIYYEKRWDVELSKSLIRALYLAVSVNDLDSIKEVYDNTVSVIEKLLNDNRPRFLIELINFILESGRKIPNVDYGLLSKTISRSIDIYKSEQPDSFHIQREFCKLRELIGKATENVELTQQAINEIFGSFLEEADWKAKNYPNGALIKSACLESALKYANDHADVLGGKANSLKEAIQKNLSVVEDQSFKKVETQISIPREKIEEYVSKFEGKETILILQEIVFGSGIIPNYAACRSNAEKQAKEFVLQHLVPVKLQHSGYTIK